MVNFLSAAIPSLIFFVLKAAYLGVRFSDTNVYFYTAVELLKGKLLYKDMFFTNLPLFPYLSSLYIFFTRGKIDFYYLTAAFEVVFTGLIIFFIVVEKTKNSFLALVLQTLYLFSFIILSTSDHQTGVFLASLFSVLAYLCYVKKHHVLTGMFLGLMFLTKAYYFPVAFGFFIYLFFNKKDQLLKTGAAFFLTCIIVLAPFIFLSPKSFFQDVFLYSLFRSQGVEKINIVLFFITYDIFFVFALFALLFFIREQLLLSLIIFFSIFTLFVYKDTYYLYLNVFIPFLILSLPLVFQRIITLKRELIIIITIFIVFSVLRSVFLYLGNYAELQKINNINNLVLIIKNAKPSFLYGTTELTPALAYLSGVPLLENIVDTNENIFNKGLLNAENLTNIALNNKTIIVTKGARYKNKNIYQPIVGNIVNAKKIIKKCINIYELPIKTEGIINLISLYKCNALD